MKYCRSFDPPEKTTVRPEMNDEELEGAIKGMGQAVKGRSTEESRQKMIEMQEELKETLGDAKMKGSYIEIHTKISFPELNKNDFTFAPPEGTILKESLFGEGLEGNTQTDSVSTAKQPDEEPREAMGENTQTESVPTAKQSDEELREAIVGTWHAEGRLVDGFSTFKADGKVEYAGTIRKDNREAVPFTATGTYKIKDSHMTVVFDTVSGSVVGIWRPGMVIRLRLIKITETEWTYEITGSMASGPHTEQRVKQCKAQLKKDET